jgi:Glycosyl hydrolases family 39
MPLSLGLLQPCHWGKAMEKSKTSGDSSFYKDAQEEVIATPLQVTSHGHSIPLSKMRRQRRLDVMLTQCADWCKKKGALTRLAFFQILRGMIVATLTITKGFDYQLYGGQEIDAAEEPQKPAGERRRVTLTDSAKVQALTEASSGSQRSVRTEEFSMVGIFDVDWLLEPRFERLLDNMAASPLAFRTVRFFGSLNSGTQEKIDPTDSGIVWPSVTRPMDFSLTFNALEALTSRGLIPFIVLSFFPSAVSSSPTLPPASFENWKRLIGGFFDQLTADPRFGASVIRNWWFEVWNEPNIHAFWKGSFSQYLDLYRATSEAVMASGLEVKLGGPAIAYQPVDDPNAPTLLMQTFLRFLSNEPEVKCDFISLHRKGATFGPDQPEMQRLITTAEETANMALGIDAARFQGIPIINNEADMKVGFDIPFEARMDEKFPAWLSGVMIAYDALSAQFRATGCRFLAASDNANQHLIQATFDGRRSIMTRASASTRDLFKVPVYNFYELLRLLGDQHGTLVTGSEHYFPNSELFHAMTVATSHLSSIFSIYPRSSSESPRTWTLDYRITDLPWSRVNMARFQIDNVHSNAYTKAGGTLSMPFPEAATARSIRLAQELTVCAPLQRDIALTNGEFCHTLVIDPFTVTVYWITPFIQDPPANPSWVEATVEDGHVILRWTPNLEPFFYSYEVYLIRHRETLELLSPVPLRAAMWVDTTPPKGVCIYGVRAISASGVLSTIVPSDPIFVA